MNVKTALLLLMTGTLALAASPDSIPAYTTVTVNKFTFSYKTDGTNLMVKLSYPTKGWLAAGFNPTAKMKNANFIIGYANSDNGFVDDQFGTNLYEHKSDTLIGGKNNLIASSCIKTGDTTTLSFTMPLDSGDPKDSKLEKGKEIKVIFAAGATTEFRKHVRSGKVKIIL